MFSRIITFITLRPYLIAIAISAFLVFWMLTPTSNLSAESANQNSPLGQVEEPILQKVQTTHYVTEEVTKSLTLYGRSEANSRAVIRAEVAGKIIKMNVNKGDYVKYKAHIANIDKRELPTRLKQAEANLVERELTYKAAKSLNDKGLQGRVRLAAVNSSLLSAEMAVEHLRLSLKRTNVVAPFSGILQVQYADIGDYVKVGDPIFSIENTDPLVIRGDVTEHHVNKLTLGQPISATLLSGEVIEGKISYIASIADSSSSTFRVEAEFPNLKLSLFSGISAKLTIPLYQVDAIYVSPAALAMDKDGNLGVKVVNEGVVEFHAIELVEADHEGAWLSGFDSEVDIITLGQGFVKVGDKVEAIDVRQFEAAEIKVKQRPGVIITPEQYHSDAKTTDSSDSLSDSNSTEK